MKLYSAFFVMTKCILQLFVCLLNRYSGYDIRVFCTEAQLPSTWVSLALSLAATASGLAVLFGVEVFAGEAALSRAFSRFVGCFEPFELRTNPEHDILNPCGFKLLLLLILRIGKGGHVHIGTPCKSWIFLARSYSRRSLLQPQGPDAAHCSKSLKKYLTEHNALADITGCLVRLAVALELTYSVEQPRFSLLWSYPPVLQALVGSGAINVPFFMSAFQGELPKPLSLRGHAPWLKVMKVVAKTT